MKETDNLIRIYSGNETLIYILRGRLESIGITSLVKNDSITAYLQGSQPQVLDLYIQEKDLINALPIINEFLEDNKD